MPPLATFDLPLTVDQAAEIMQCHPQSVYGWIAEDRIAASRVGRHIRVTESALRDFMASRTANPLMIDPQEFTLACGTVFTVFIDEDDQLVGTLHSHTMPLEQIEAQARIGDQAELVAACTEARRRFNMPIIRTRK